MRTKVVLIHLARAALAFAIAGALAGLIWSALLQIRADLYYDVVFGWSALSIVPPLLIAGFYFVLTLGERYSGDIREWKLNFAFFPVLVGHVEGKKRHIWWEFYEARITDWFMFGGKIEFRPCRHIRGLIALPPQVMIEPDVV